VPQKSKTKIIATIGPSCWKKETISSMIESGMDVARINTSFADEAEIIKVSTLIRSISPKIAIMLDIMGHKVRVTGIDDKITVKEGENISILPDTGHSLGNGYISTTYKDLFQFLKPNDKVLIDDGNIQLDVVEIKEKEIVTKVIEGGEVKKGKTINIPNVHLEFGGLTEKDIKDIKIGIDNHVDFIATSFVRNKEDVLLVKELTNGSGIKIVSKVEDGEGVAKIDEIIDNSDAIMIARGDMGVELPFEQVPMIQKSIIRKCREDGKPVIVATQMLESMKENIRPTRAEVSDVTNAVFDGTDCVMLSAETATGKYPEQSVIVMNKIALEAEKDVQTNIIFGKTDASEETDGICKTIAENVDQLDVRGVIVPTKTGRTVASITRHRLDIPIWGVTTSIQLFRQLSMFFGVEPIFTDSILDHRDELIKQIVEVVYSKGNLELTDKVAIISGSTIFNKSINSIFEIVKICDVIG
jgi:pyruvate kinase